MRTLNVIFGGLGVIGGLTIACYLPMLVSWGLGGIPVAGFGFAAVSVLRIGAGLLRVGLVGTDREQFEV